MTRCYNKDGFECPHEQQNCCVSLVESDPCEESIAAPTGPIKSWKCFQCGRTVEYWRDTGGPYGELQCECGQWFSILGHPHKGPVQDVDFLDAGEYLDPEDY